MTSVSHGSAFMGKTVSNSIWNVGGLLVSILLVFLTMPWILRMLGTERYGVFTILTSMLVPLGLANLSLGQATIKYVAESYGKGAQEEAGTYVRTTLLFNIGVGAVGSLVLVLFAHKLVIGIFNIAAPDQPLAEICLYWIAAAWSVNQISTTYNAVPAAIQRYDLVSIGTVIFTVFNTCLGLAVLALGGNLLSFVQAFFASQVIGMIGWYFLARRLMPGISLAPRWDGRAFHRSFRFGFWQTVAQVGGLAASQADKYVIGILLPMSALGLYSIALQVEQRAYMVVYKVSEVLFPTFSHIQGEENRRREGLAVMRSSWLLSTLAATLLVPVVIWSQEFLRLWLRDLATTEASRVLQVITLAGLLGSGTNACIFYLMGIGKTTWCAVNSILTGAVVLAGSLLLVPKLGLVGAGWGNVLSMLVRIVIVVVIWRVFFRSDMAWTVYVSAVYGPTLLGLALGVAILELKPRLPAVTSWLGLAVGAAAAAAVIALTIIAVDGLLPGGRIRRNDVKRIVKGIVAGVRWPLPRLSNLNSDN